MSEINADLTSTLALLAPVVASAPDLEYAFLAGSVAAGFGSPTSDLDLFVGGSPQTIAFVRDVVPSRIGLRRIDVEQVDQLGLEQACDDLSRLAERIPDAPTALLYAMEPQIKIVGAALHAVGLPSPCPEAAFVLSKALEARSAYRRVLNARSNVWVNNTAEDLRGLLLAEDDLPTRRRAHDLLELALDMWLTTTGEDYPDEKYKWVTHRLRRIPLDRDDQRAIFDAYHPEQNLPTGPKEPHRVAGLAQVLRMRALLVENFSIRIVGAPLAIGTAPSSLQCLPWLIVGVSNDEVRVTTHGGAWSLPIPAMVVLALATGRERVDLVEATAHVLDRSELLGMSRLEIDGIVQKLLDSEILVQRWIS